MDLNRIFSTGSAACHHKRENRFITFCCRFFCFLFNAIWFSFSFTVITCYFQSVVNEWLRVRLKSRRCSSPSFVVGGKAKLISVVFCLALARCLRDRGRRLLFPFVSLLKAKTLFSFPLWIGTWLERWMADPSDRLTDDDWHNADSQLNKTKQEKRKEKGLLSFRINALLFSSHRNYRPIGTRVNRIFASLKWLRPIKNNVSFWSTLPCFSANQNDSLDSTTTLCFLFSIF